MVRALQVSGGLRHLHDNLLIILHLLPLALPHNTLGGSGGGGGGGGGGPISKS